MSEQTGINFKVINAPRRGGDPDELVADSEKIRHVLGWNPRYSDINTMIQSAWNWTKMHPNGFKQ
ncbi:MAG: hypothetical protein ABF778_08220 [Liquorilactobacillus hordei]|uniref:hypothetical protein n=1 Tax=Liquorilactobacillus hordei TaxID=468911 RepID=UPI0039EC88E6